MLSNIILALCLESGIIHHDIVKLKYVGNLLSDIENLSAHEAMSVPVLFYSILF